MDSAGIATGAVAADRGGYFPTTWGWAAVPLCWVAVMALFVRDHISLSRLELAFLGVLLAIPGWYALSVLWSRDVPQTILEVDGFTDADVRFDPSRPSTIPVRLMDDSLARREFGFVPRVPLEEGLRRTLAWYRQNGPRKRL